MTMRMRAVGLLLSLLAGSAFATTTVDALVPHAMHLRDGRTVTLNLPAGLTVSPLAEGFRRPRFFARSPDGRLFLTEMDSLADNNRGAVYILDGFDAARGTVARVTPWMTGLRNPNSVAFHTDADHATWIYVAVTNALLRYRYTPGELHPTGKPQVIATFPDHGLSAANGGWHLTRTVVPGPDGKLYVSIGSSCNACRESIAERDRRAVVLQMDPDGGHARVFARGVRNAVWMGFVDGRLMATNQGVDHLGPDLPNETFQALEPDTDYGWPSCYVDGTRIRVDPKYPRASGCTNVGRPVAVFQAHASALGFDWFPAGGTKNDVLDGQYVVALHGSGSPLLGHGYRMVRMDADGHHQQDFITGFLVKGKVQGRPCGVIRLGPDRLLFTDDKFGVVYYVRPTGTAR